MLCVQMIDTHTHIYENEFADDLTDTIARAEEAGVEKFVFPAIDSESYQRMVSTWEKLPGKAFCCMQYSRAFLQCSIASFVHCLSDQRIL